MTNDKDKAVELKKLNQIIQRENDVPLSLSEFETLKGIYELLKTLQSERDPTQDAETKQNTTDDAALEFIQSYKLLLNNMELCMPKNGDGTVTIPPWLRDCRKHLEHEQTIRAALTDRAKLIEDIRGMKIDKYEISPIPSQHDKADGRNETIDKILKMMGE